MTRRDTPDSRFKCSACGVQFTNWGSLGSHGRRSKSCTPMARFWGKVNKAGAGGCWLWTGAEERHGYGHFRIGRKDYRAHRLSWSIVNGPIPPRMEILHSCDVKACVNPAHLRPGTHHDNMRDAVAKDRHTRGERNSHAKLTDEQVREIRRLWIRTSYRESNAAELAARFKTRTARIYSIMRGDAWKHIK